MNKIVILSVVVLVLVIVGIILTMLFKSKSNSSSVKTSVSLKNNSNLPSDLTTQRSSSSGNTTDSKTNDELYGNPMN